MQSAGAGPGAAGLTLTCLPWGSCSGLPRPPGALRTRADKGICSPGTGAVRPGNGSHSRCAVPGTQRAVGTRHRGAPTPTDGNVAHHGNPALNASLLVLWFIKCVQRSVLLLEITSNGVCGAAAPPVPVAGQTDAPSTFPAGLQMWGTNTPQHKQAQSRAHPEPGLGTCRAQEVTKMGTQVPEKVDENTMLGQMAPGHISREKQKNTESL